MFNIDNVSMTSSVGSFLSAYIPYHTKDISFIIAVKDNVTTIIYNNLKKMGMKVFNIYEDNIDDFAYNEYNILVDTVFDKVDHLGNCNLCIGDGSTDVDISIINGLDLSVGLVISSHYTRQLYLLYKSYMQVV
jgi:hypothetical protein